MATTSAPFKPHIAEHVAIFKKVRCINRIIDFGPITFATEPKPPIVLEEISMAKIPLGNWPRYLWFFEYVVSFFPQISVHLLF